MKVIKLTTVGLVAPCQLLLLTLAFSIGANSVRAQENVVKLRDGLRIKFGAAQVELTAATADDLWMLVGA